MSQQREEEEVGSSTETKPQQQQQQRQQQPPTGRYQPHPSKYAGLTTQEFWAVKKKERKERVKARKRDAHEEKQRAWHALSPEEQAARKEQARASHEQKRKEQAEMEARSTARLNDPQTPALVFDLQFASSMAQRDIKSTMNQLKISYATLRRGGFILRPMFFDGSADEKRRNSENKRKKNSNNNQNTVEDDDDDDSGDDQEEEEQVQQQQQQPRKTDSGGGDVVDEDIFKHLKAYDGFSKFPPTFVSASVSTLDRETTVYLTADSPNVLLDFKPGEKYVIGSFVDHNQMKGATYNVATAAGMRTARLPLDEMIKIGNRCKVLTINHVVEVMVGFAQHHDWKRAFMDHLPVRRVATPTNNNPSSSASVVSLSAASGEAEEGPVHHEQHHDDDDDDDDEQHEAPSSVLPHRRDRDEQQSHT